MKKPETNATKANDCGVMNTFTVDHVRNTKNGVYFSLTLNGVTINNCRVVEGKNGDFLSLPQYKGNDGKYYNIVWFKFSDADSQQIIALVEQMLNA